jgi:hypothetical protein
MSVSLVWSQDGMAFVAQLVVDNDTLELDQISLISQSYLLDPLHLCHLVSRLPAVKHLNMDHQTNL